MDAKGILLDGKTLPKIRTQQVRFTGNDKLQGQAKDKKCAISSRV